MRCLFLILLLITLPSLHAADQQQQLMLTDLGLYSPVAHQASSEFNWHEHQLKKTLSRGLSFIPGHSGTRQSGPMAAWGGGIRLKSFRHIASKYSVIYSNLKISSNANRNERKIGANYHFYFE